MVIPFFLLFQKILYFCNLILQFMRRLVFLLCTLVLASSCLLAKPVDTLSASRLEFVPNLGQWGEPFQFRASLPYAAVFFDENGYVVNMLDPQAMQDFHPALSNGSSPLSRPIRAAAYRVVFEASDALSRYFPLGKAFPHYYNYFLSSDLSAWRPGVPVYPALHRPSLYPGVDFTVSQSEGYIKYEFHIAPDADPSLIRMRYEGVRSLTLSSNHLVIDNHIARVVELAPYAYQISAQGDTLPVECHYKLNKNVVSFSLGRYDQTLPLVIDPVVVFSSYSGSTADNWGYTATYDAHGNLYGGGIAFGTGYPITFGAYQTQFCTSASGTTTDVAITKFDSAGTNIFYSTYLGGSYVDIPHSLYVNDNDELYVFGTTASPDFPVTPDAFDTSFNHGTPVTLSTSLAFPLGADVFVARFSANGRQLLSSTFVGGSGNDGVNTAVELRKNYADDNRGEILMDVNSNVYVVTSTYSPDFPVTPNAYDTSYNGYQDVCVFKMSYDLSQMIWSTFLGGSGNDAGYSMMLANDESVYVCGGTSSQSFPVVAGALQSALAGDADGFVSHLSPNGDYLMSSTYLGSPDYDQAYLIKGDRLSVPHIFGQTSASGTTWVQNAQYYTSGGGQFLTKLTPSLNAVEWSTVFGSGLGGPDISPTALLVDYCSNIYMSGWGSFQLNGFGGTNGLPITQDAFQSTTDGSDYYFICLSDDVSQLVYGSFFGGAAYSAREHVDGGTSRFDRKGRIYQAVCAGCGGQSSFPTTPGAWSTTNGSTNCNLGVIKMDFSLPVVVADFRMPSTVCLPDTVSFVNQSQTIDNSTSYFWDFGDGTTSTQIAPSHYYAHSGYYNVTLIVQDLGSCNFADTLTKMILVLANMVDTLSDANICYGDFVQIGIPPSVGVDYHWSPGTSLSNSAVSNPIAAPVQSTLYRLVATTQHCTDTFYQRVNVDTSFALLSSDTTICRGDAAHLTLSGVSDYVSITWSLSPDFSQVIAQNQLALEVSPAQTTTYYVRVVERACIYMESVTVTVSEVHLALLPEVLICFEDSTQLAVATDCVDCQYQWVLGDGSAYAGESPFVSPAASTSYSITVTNAYGCSASATGNIVKRTGTFPTPFSAWCEICVITQADSTILFSTDYGNGYHYQWEPVTEDMTTPNAANTIVAPLQDMVYTVAVTDTFGCVMSDTVFIKVNELICDDPYIFIPNAFSPNGDGLNDVLYVRSRILESFYFAVYSRWGQKVFETTRFDEGWDGTFQGQPCQNGVYDFYFKGICVGGQTNEIKGNVMLIR